MKEDWRAGLDTKEERYTLSGRKVRLKDYLKTEPYLCKECNRVWQPIYSYDASNPEFVMGFPKIGCTIRTCVHCE